MFPFKNTSTLVFLGLVTILFGACNENRTDTIKPVDTSPTLFTLLDATKTNITFENTIVNQKDFNIFKYRNYYNGGGVAIGDINNDGLPDIFFSANMSLNKLYLNKVNLEIEDILL